jgi:hypothetical protein
MYLSTSLIAASASGVVVGSAAPDPGRPQVHATDAGLVGVKSEESGNRPKGYPDKRHAELNDLLAWPPGLARPGDMVVIGTEQPCFHEAANALRLQDSRQFLQRCRQGQTHAEAGGMAIIVVEDGCEDDLVLSGPSS